MSRRSDMADKDLAFGGQNGVRLYKDEQKRTWKHEWFDLGPDGSVHPAPRSDYRWKECGRTGYGCPLKGKKARVHKFDRFCSTKCRYAYFNLYSWDRID